MPARPVSVTIAAAIEALEGFAVVVAGGYVAWETIVGQPRDLPSAIALSVIAVVTGVLIIFVGRGLWQTRRWSRAPAVITQMFVLIVAVPMVQGGQRGIGTPLVVGAVVAMVLLLMPETAQALVEEPSPREPESPGESDTGARDSAQRDKAQPNTAESNTAESKSAERDDAD